MNKIIAHIDLNAFFVRAEEIKNPNLIDKPVAIGHEGRAGIVSTCSYKAREYGVCSGMPMFKATQLCPNLIILPGDYHFYKALSASFFKFIQKYTKIVEMASIDECFGDFTNCIKEGTNLEKYFKDLQYTLLKETKLKCSIGVAPTKFLAKMGSDYKKPMGLTMIGKSNIQDLLFPLSIDKMFGIGKKSAPRLVSIGINTIGDFYSRLIKNDPELNVLLGKSYDTFKDWLSGKGDDNVITIAEDPKSIGHSTTLYNDTSDINEIEPIIKKLAYEVSKDALKSNKLGNTIQIVIKEPNFKVRNKSVTFDKAVNDMKSIYKYALKLYLTNFSNITIRLIGITLQNLKDRKDITYQMSLFEEENDFEIDSTKDIIDDLNKHFNKDVLKRASEVVKK